MTIEPSSAALAAVAALALAGAFAPVAAADTGVLGFEQAWQRARERSAEVALAGSAREMAAERLREARRWENPTLEVEAENILGRGRYSGLDSAETTVSLAQPLPLGGGRAARQRAAREGSAAAEVEADLALRALRRDLAIAYAGAVAADRRAAIARERGRIGAETRSAVERRFAAGLDSELQRSRAEVEAGAAQAAVRREAAAAQVARRRLAAFWREEDLATALDDAWFDAPAAPTPAPDAPDAQVAAGAQGAPGDAHPRLILARHRVAQAQALLDAARGARFGGLEATIGARRFRDEPAGDDRAWVLGLSMPLPLWDRNGAAIAEARAALLAAELDAEREARALTADRSLAAAELDSARLEVESLVASGLPAATLAAELTRKGHEAGRLPLLERLAAERDLAAEQARLVDARLRLREAEARLASLR